MSDRPVIVWFRHDLRLRDQRALTAARATGAPLVLVYVLDDESPGAWKMGAASRWWLHHSLASLAAAIETRGGRLTLRRGDARRVICDLVTETSASAVYMSRAYEPWAIALEQDLKRKLEADGVALKRYGGALFKEPEDLKTQAGEPYKVYTPFWKALSHDFKPAKGLPAPSELAGPGKATKSETLKSWGLLPSKPDWAKGFVATWTPGEEGADQRLTDFLDGPIGSYSEDRNRPGVEGTSRLSPHLHFGEICPHTCWSRALIASAGKHGSDRGTETFLKELVWREFSYHLLFHWPDLPEAPFRKEFARFAWKPGRTHFHAWKKGQTGYPIVDAGMRELWATGYMHNRVRMIVASFLIKDLLIPWQDGEAWFWDTLVDADLASNSASWQWVAGSGADAAPYFRIFNPVTQGEKFDADAAYVRCWVPEISALPDDVIHAPWTASAATLKAAGVTLGKSYPQPIVDHATARAAALHAYAALKD